MKNSTLKFLLLSTLLFASIPCKSQTFTLSTEIGQGFKFIDYHNPQFYMVESTIKPAVDLLYGKLNATSIIMGAFSDGVSYIFGGTGAGYEVYRKEDFAVELGATALFGSEGKVLYGLNANVNINTSVYLTVNARQEYTQKEFWFDGGVGARIF